MSAGVRWTVDRRAIAQAQVREAAGDALGDAAEFLLETANRTVPIEEGTLAGSGSTDVDHRALQASVSYDTPYAARQHEELRWRHDPGRRAKWLELALRENAGQIRDHIADAMRRRIR